MKKNIRLFLTILGLSAFLSCQNELVKRIEDQLQVDTPVISEEADGLDKIITISSSTDGAQIYYTTNNTEPVPGNSDALLYSGPLELSGHGESVYLRTRAFKKDMTPSSETVAQFGNIYPSPPPPVLSRAGGVFSTVQSIGIQYPDLTGTLWETDGVTIHYTTDGSTPTSASPIYRPGITAEISVNPGTENDTATVIINAISIHPNYPPSRAASGVYTVTYLEKAPAPTIIAVDQSNSTSLSSGIVFGPAEVTVTPQTGSVLHYRTRQDAEDWSDWNTSSTASVLTILDDSPRDGAVVTVQAYVSRAGYRNSDMSISSFSYLILTVPPPCLTMVCPFSSGSTYGRDFMIDFESFDDMTVYFTVDGTVPVPGTEGISGSSTHLFSGSPVTGDDDWLYNGEMVTGQPLLINAVHESGGRVSPVSTYWCNVDVTPPAAPSTFICDGGHERVTFSYTGMPADVNDMIITYNNGVYGDDTSLTNLPTNSAHIEDLPSNNSTYAIGVVIRDQYRNERVLMNEEIRVCSVTNTADSGPGSLRQAVLDAGAGDTITFDSAVFDTSNGDDVIRLNSTIEISQNQTIDGDADGDGYGDVVISGGTGFSGPAIKVSEAAQLTLAFRDLSFENLRSTDSNTSALFLAINSETAVTIESCAFINNECASAAAEQGGAVYIKTLANTIYTPVEITDCVFVGNSTEERGGAVCSLFQPLLITGSLFAKNSADSSIGGGAVAVYPPDITGFKPLTINNSTFFENASGNPGSKAVVIYNIAGSSPEIDGRSVIINESIFWDYNDGNSNGQVLNSLNFSDDLTINIDHSIVNGGVDMDPIFETPGAADYSTDGIWFNGDDALRIADASPCNINSSGDDVGCYANASANPFLSGLTRVYVKETNSNTPLTGANWDSALTDPQQAIDLAYWYGLSEVWVASGIYHPQSQPNGGSGGQRDNHFAMREGVSVVGGFIAGESTRATSDLDDSGAIDPWEFTNATVFSGDFNNNDDEPLYVDGYYESMSGNTSENACHVIFNNAAFSDSKIPVVDGITIEGGNANTSRTTLAGGGICQINGANVIYKNCTISENQTDFGASPAGGGGIYQDGGTLTLTDCLLTRNKADDGGQDPDGGAIMLRLAEYNITGCRFYNNRSSGTAACIYFNNCDSGTGTIERNVFAHNKAQSSTVMKLYQMSNRTISRCLFEDNYANNQGSCISYQDSTLNTIKQCVFTGNKGFLTAGGAINLVDDVSLNNNITNCVFYNNLVNFQNYPAGVKAGGCGNTLSTDLNISKCILIDNSFLNESFITIENSISSYDYGGSFPTIVLRDPVFANAANPLGDDGVWYSANGDDGFNISEWSYANFDSGDDWGAYANTTDNPLRGTDSRIYVRSGAGGGDGTGRNWDNPIWNDLQSGIDTAVVFGTETVRVGGGTYTPSGWGGGPGADRTAHFELASDLKIQGGWYDDGETDRETGLPNNHQTILSGGDYYSNVLGTTDINGKKYLGSLGTLGNNTDNCNNVINNAVDPGIDTSVTNAEMESLVIRGGNADSPGQNETGSYGGGLRLKNSELTISYCIFENNYALNGGGAIFARDSKLNIDNSVFRINEAGIGGNNPQGVGAGLCLLGPNTDCTIQDSRFETNLLRNDSTNTGGGAIHIDNNTVQNAQLRIRQTIFRQNRSNCDAGAIGIGSNSHVSIINSIFDRNYAQTECGGVELLLGMTNNHLYAINNLFYGNYSFLGFQGQALRTAVPGGEGRAVFVANNSFFGSENIDSDVPYVEILQCTGAYVFNNLMVYDMTPGTYYYVDDLSIDGLSFKGNTGTAGDDFNPNDFSVMGLNTLANDSDGLTMEEAKNHTAFLSVSSTGWNFAGEEWTGIGVYNGADLDLNLNDLADDSYNAFDDIAGNRRDNGFHVDIGCFEYE